MTTRNLNEVIVLGCGLSINDLSDAEREHINRCKVVVAINKFAAYCKEAGIVPTHVYYTDTHTNSNQFLQHMFDVLRGDGVRDVCFILNKEYRFSIASCRFVLPLLWVPARLAKGLRRAFFRNFSTIKDWVFVPLRFAKGFCMKTCFFHVPRCCSFSFVEPDVLGKGKKWATSLKEPLYHFRGSLTTVLNFVSIVASGFPVKLVGTDFYGNRYFFEEKLHDLSFSCDSWVTERCDKENKHYSALVIDDETMFDRFGEVMRYMKQSENPVYVCNEKSLLHTQVAVPYCSVRDVIA